MRSLYSLLFIGLFLVFALDSPGQTISIKIIETSDVHGAIFPFDWIKRAESKGSLARVKTYVQEERMNQKQKVILVDNGDIIQGDPAVYFYNSIDSTENLMAAVMNDLEYDLAVVGNHDIEQGHPIFNKFKDELNFPWIAANAINTETLEPWFTPYHIEVRDGIKIAFLGLITPAIPNWLHPSLYEGMQFEDMIQSANHWIPIIQEKEKPHLIIGLFHAGVNPNYGGQSAEDPFNENASVLVAEQVSGLDAVMVGHDHHGWNKWVKSKDGKDVLIVGPTSRAKDVAEITATFDALNKKLVKLEGNVVPMEPYSPATPFFEQQNNDIAHEVNKRIGSLEEDLVAREALFMNSAFVDLIHQVQLNLTQADVSFSASMAFDHTLRKGELKVADVFALYRYENLCYTIELSGKEIDAYLEYSYGNWFNQMQTQEDHLLRFERDEKGQLKEGWNGRPQIFPRFYNFDTAAGIDYEVDISKDYGDRITIIKMSNGDLFKEDNTYKVAVNSYRGNGGGGHLSQGLNWDREMIQDKILWVSEKDLRYYLLEYIQEKGKITPNALGNWKIVPEELWKAGMNRDYLLLFGEE